MSKGPNKNILQEIGSNWGSKDNFEEKKLFN